MPTRRILAESVFPFYRASAERLRIAELVTNPPAPTKALRELMRGQDD